MANHPRKISLEELKHRDLHIREALLSSYGLMTAEKILRKLNVHLSPFVIRLAIQKASSFYYSLLKLPAMIIFNGLIYDQTHDLQSLLQERMIEYLYSEEAKKAEDEPGLYYREEMEKIRLKLVDFNDRFAAFSKQCDLTERMILTNLRDKANEWQALGREVSAKLCQELTENGEELPKHFEFYLTTLICQEGIGIELTPEQLKRYGVEGEANYLQKSMIYLLEKNKETA